MSNPNDYTVGWICALSTEYVAAQEFLDDEHEPPEFVSPNDTNDYTLGRLGKHNVVIAVLPDGEYGTASAASVATNMLHSFPNVRIGLMVGIGGGVPSRKHDIRLGDIVVSAPRDGEGGVFQYDFGKTIQEQAFQHTRFLNQPPTILRTAVTGIQAQHMRKGHQLEEAIRLVLEKNPRLRQEYARPQPSTDWLFYPHVIHDSRGCVAVCAKDLSHLVERQGRATYEHNPAIHYGLVASANQLMKDAVIRDRLTAEKDVLCFEMEAAGLMNHFPCLVIRGICDYSDSHKNKEWQGYASMAAAAYAKELVSRITPNKVEAEKRIIDVLSSVQIGVDETRLNTRFLINEQRREKLIAKLPYAKGSTFDSFGDDFDSRCHPETRLDLRRQIKEWAEDEQGKCIFWLKGMAGTGKSTISRTVADSFEREGSLGASFFFRRGEGDRGNATMFFTTLCAQLLIKLPELTPLVETAIDNDPYIWDKSLKEKFEKLIYHPLSMIHTFSRKVSKVIVVIDALDECEREGDVRMILKLLSQTKSIDSIDFRVLVTSRPELPIRLGFKDISEDTYQDLVLHEMPTPIIEHDITAFMKTELSRIRQDYDLPIDWPGETRLQTLAAMASPLFIFAATVCRFIDTTKWDPEERLVTILKYTTTSRISAVDGIYLPILDRILTDLTDRERDQLIQEYQKIIGSIIILEDPLPSHCLAHLLKIPPKTMERRLDPLHSVLSIPANPGSPVRLLHLSLRDFLLDTRTREKTPFWIDERMAHNMMAERCLEDLSQCLRQNICSLENLGTLRAEIDSTTITNCLPLDVQYSCRFWVRHLEQSKNTISDSNSIRIFLRDHFLHWLESMSLLGRISETISLIRTLQTLVSDEKTELYPFLNDAMRFIRKNISIVDQAPLQLYTSALIFAPKTSIIKNTFIKEIPSWIQKLPEVDSAWSALQQTLEGHSGWVIVVAFSPDGKLVASGSRDGTVKLWDPATGTLQQTLEDHSGSVETVVFSPDGKLVASGSYNRTVKLWDPATGALQQTLEGHSGSVETVVFSPNGKLVASGSRDGTAKLWDPATGALQQTLKGQSGSVKTVVFSPDGKLVASGSYDGTVKLWDPTTGTLQQTLEGHSGSVETVVFSPDGKLAASGSSDRTVKLWDPATGALQHTFDGHSGSVKAVVFSPNAELVASSSNDERIKLWDPATGALQQTLEGHSGWVRAVKFSPDGKLVASGSYDGTVKLWDPATGTLQQTLHGHSNSVNAVVFSPDSKIVASGSDDKTVKLWDAAANALQQTPEGHSNSVGAVVFSPDGELVASGSRDGTIKLWNPATGALQQTLEGHSDWVMAVAFSVDSKLVASRSYDGLYNEYKLWDPATGALQQTLQSYYDWSKAAASSPVGKFLESGQGRFDVKSLDLRNPSLTASSLHNKILVKNEWVTRNDTNVIWLPVEYRATRFHIYKSMLVMGHASGRVTFLKLI